MKTLLAALPVVALILAAPAAADITDNEFLAALDMAHVAVDSGGTSKIAVAHNICMQYDEGYSNSDIIGFMYHGNMDSMTRWDAAFFVGAATAAYCPEYAYVSHLTQQ